MFVTEEFMITADNRYTRALAIVGKRCTYMYLLMVMCACGFLHVTSTYIYTSASHDDGIVDVLDEAPSLGTTGSIIYIVLYVRHFLLHGLNKRRGLRSMIFRYSPWARNSRE